MYCEWIDSITKEAQDEDGGPLPSHGRNEEDEEDMDSEDEENDRHIPPDSAPIRASVPSSGAGASAAAAAGGGASRANGLDDFDSEEDD